MKNIIIDLKAFRQKKRQAVIDKFVKGHKRTIDALGAKEKPKSD